MRATLPEQIETLFARYPALCGFSVRGVDDIPDSCARSGDEAQLFVGDLAISASVGAEEYSEIFTEVLAALSELLSEHPQGDGIRGRTFARVLH